MKAILPLVKNLEISNPPAERKTCAKDRSRMQLQSKGESNAQGGKMSQYSKEKNKENKKNKENELQ